MKPVDGTKIKILCQMLSAARRVAVVGHTHPDGDAIGSTRAAAEYLRKVRGLEALVFLPTAPPSGRAFIADDEQLCICEADPELCLRRLAACDLILCLDFNDFARTDGLADTLRTAKASKILIDHHLNPHEADFSLVFSDTQVSSASELLYKVLLAMPDIGGDASKLPLTCATALMCGMTDDTNNFANSVWPDTLAMASDLLAAGVDRDSIIEKLYNSYRSNRVAAMSRLLDEHLVIRPDGVAYMIITRDFWQQYGLQDGELEGLVNIPLTIDEVKISIYLREDTDHFHASIRSKRGWSANKLAVKYFHGGGHEQASGGKLFFPQDVAKPEDAAQYLNNIEV